MLLLGSEFGRYIGENKGELKHFKCLLFYIFRRQFLSLAGIRIWTFVYLQREGVGCLLMKVERFEPL